GYMRVIPRDLFNEANLLKCLGHFWIKTEGSRHVRIEHAGGPFVIAQDESDGSLSVGNVHVFIRDQLCTLTRPLNSRAPWPLYLRSETHDEVPVFMEDGELSPELRALIDAV